MNTTIKMKCDKCGLMKPVTELEWLKEDEFDGVVCVSCKEEN